MMAWLVRSGAANSPWARFVSGKAVSIVEEVGQMHYLRPRASASRNQSLRKRRRTPRLPRRLPISRRSMLKRVPAPVERVRQEMVSAEEERSVPRQELVKGFEVSPSAM